MHRQRCGDLDQSFTAVSAGQRWPDTVRADIPLIYRNWHFNHVAYHVVCPWLMLCTEIHARITGYQHFQYVAAAGQRWPALTAVRFWPGRRTSADVTVIVHENAI
jgi:hypothetical protein